MKKLSLMFISVIFAIAYFTTSNDAQAISNKVWQCKYEHYNRVHNKYDFLTEFTYFGPSCPPPSHTDVQAEIVSKLGAGHGTVVHYNIDFTLNNGHYIQYSGHTEKAGEDCRVSTRMESTGLN